MIVKMRVLTSEEQTWKNGPMQLVTLTEAGSHRLKHTVEMARPLKEGLPETGRLVDQEVLCHVTEITQMGGRIVFRGQFELAKPLDNGATSEPAVPAAGDKTKPATK